MDKQLITATLAYLEDWENDGHSIIPVETLATYGFSAPWLRDLAEHHQSGDDPKWQIRIGRQVVKEMLGVWTLDLLEAVISELGIDTINDEAVRKPLARARRVSGRGTTAQLYTEAIRAAIANRQS